MKCCVEENSKYDCYCGKQYDEERAFYNSKNLCLDNVSFDGPLDGESALKECNNIVGNNIYFNLRYPMWHDHGINLSDSTLTSNCRAALWYSDHINIDNTKMYGIKAVRECKDINISNCDIISPEFGWFNNYVNISNSKINSEYFMLHSNYLKFNNIEFSGKYSFQYVNSATISNSVLDTKDAFWHSDHVTVKDSIVKGEYLGWYSNHLTFINCTIIGTQPLCYCKNLELVNCKMIDCDLAFEKSTVNASIVNHMISIKNPLEGEIIVPGVDELIIDDDESKANIVYKEGLS